MGNTWIVMPSTKDFDGMSEIISSLTGGFVTPETYETREFSQEKSKFEIVQVPHPYLNSPAPNFSNKIIIVHADGPSEEFDNVVNLVDDGSEINIFRSINLGISYAFENGATSVVVIKEPTAFDPFIILESEKVLEVSSKTVVSINGFNMFMISSSCTLRFDEQFQLWFGDNDFFVNLDNLGGTDYVAQQFCSFDILFDWSSIDGASDITSNDEAKYKAKHG